MTKPSSESPWRTLPAGRPASIALEPKAQPGVSWWTSYAQPDTPFEQFSAALQARDMEMRTQSWGWRAVKAEPST